MTTAPGLNGIRWRSLVDDDGFVVAVFDRARLALSVIETERFLESRLMDIEACFELYAAGVVEARNAS